MDDYNYRTYLLEAIDNIQRAEDQLSQSRSLLTTEMRSLGIFNNDELKEDIIWH